MGIVIVYFALVNITYLSKIDHFDRNVLLEQERMIEMELFPLLKDPDAHSRQIKRLKEELFWVSMQIKRDQFNIDGLFYLLGFLAVGLFVYVLVKDNNKKSVTKRIKELTPTEKYVDEYEYERARLSGFATKEDALNWFAQDQLRRCEYCGGRNVPTSDSNPDQVQFCTFYKRVPEGAKDLRIVLGSVWNVVPAQNLICASCDRTVHRG